MRRTLLATAALTATLPLLGAGCGGTLEGKYRRGQLTTSTTAPRQAPATTAPTNTAPPSVPAGPASSTTSTTATSGNAVRTARPG